MDFNNNFKETELDESALTDIDTAKGAVRWALDKIKNLREDILRLKQEFNEKNAMVNLLDGEVKAKNEEIQRLMRLQKEELTSLKENTEKEFSSRNQRLLEREKELESRIGEYEAKFSQRERKLMDDYQKKSEELRGRWSKMEEELWSLRQSQMLKNEDFEKSYREKLEEEKKNISSQTESLKAELEKQYALKNADFERRKNDWLEEMKKQEAVLKWAKDSFSKEASQRELDMKKKEAEVDRKLTDAQIAAQAEKSRLLMLENEVANFSGKLSAKDEDIIRYRQAIESMENVVRTLQAEKQELKNESDEKKVSFLKELEKEKKKISDMEAEIPVKLKTALEHERDRYNFKLKEIEAQYRRELEKRNDEIKFLSENMRTMEEAVKTFQNEKSSLENKNFTLEDNLKTLQNESAFKEKQLRTEFDVTFRMEREKILQKTEKELEESKKIFEDSLRMKVEEIAHLKGELENYNAALAAARQEISRLSKNMEDERLKSIAEISETKRLSAEESKNQTFKFEAEKRELEDSLSKKFALKIDDLKKGFEQEKSSYEDKISALKARIDAAKLEKEESILIERERLKNAYLEKESLLDGELSAKNKEINRLKESIAVEDANAAHLRAEINRLETMANENTAREKALNQARESELRRKIEEQIAQLKLNYEELLSKKDSDMEALAASFREKEANYLKSIGTLEDKVSSLDSLSEGLKSKMEGKEDYSRQLILEIEKFKNSLSQRDKEFFRIKSECENKTGSLEREVEDLLNEKETLNAETSSKINDLMVKLRNMEQERNNLEKELNGALKLTDVHRYEISRKDSHLAELKEEIEKIKEEYSRNMQDVSAKEMNHKNKIEILENDIMARDNAINELKMERRKKEEVLSEKENELNRLRDIEASYAENKKDLESLKKKIEKFMKDK